MTGNGQDCTQAHYERLAARYDENWAYSPAYITWMAGCILDRASIRVGERVADIGCGTGLYSRALAASAGQVICIDPSQAMLDQLPADPALIPVRASAEDIAAGRVRLPGGQLDVIVMKEAVHHIPAADRPQVLHGLAAEHLAPGGRSLIVMLPARIRYPLFTAALEQFERLQPDPAGIASLLSGAGLDTEVTCESYPLTLAKDRYLAMVRDRYMSLLDLFDDTQIEHGISEIRQSHHGDTLEFADEFAFIHATRHASPQ
jgi:SAM-dependent methyltransferase